jgi:hypothetical protein
MKERNDRRFWLDAPRGLFFETVARMANHLRTWLIEPIDFFPEFERNVAMSLFSRAAIF